MRVMLCGFGCLFQVDSGHYQIFARLNRPVEKQRLHYNPYIYLNYCPDTLNNLISRQNKGTVMNEIIFT